MTLNSSQCQPRRYHMSWAPNMCVQGQEVITGYVGGGNAAVYGGNAAVYGGLCTTVTRGAWSRDRCSTCNPTLCRACAQPASTPHAHSALA
eukprot:3828252-Rhodomonas_salina.2